MTDPQNQSRQQRPHSVSPGFRLRQTGGFLNACELMPSETLWAIFCKVHTGTKCEENCHPPLWDSTCKLHWSSLLLNIFRYGSLMQEWFAESPRAKASVQRWQSIQCQANYERKPFSQLCFNMLMESPFSRARVRGQVFETNTLLQVQLFNSLNTTQFHFSTLGCFRPRNVLRYSCVFLYVDNFEIFLVWMSWKHVLHSNIQGSKMKLRGVQWIEQLNLQ